MNLVSYDSSPPRACNELHAYTVQGYRAGVMLRCWHSRHCLIRCSGPSSGDIPYSLLANFCVRLGSIVNLHELLGGMIASLVVATNAPIEIDSQITRLPHPVA